jgi:hypothetical protein
LNGSAGSYSDTVSQEMGILVGDTGGNGTVNSGDFSQTRGQPVTILNFRQDVNADGVIDNEDLKLVKSKSGTALPSFP